MLQKYVEQHRNQLAFTLIELMVTVIIIVILTSVITFAALAQQKTSRDAARDAQSVLIAEALEKYYDKNNEYPSVASLANQPIETVKQKLGISNDEILKMPLAEASQAPIIADDPDISEVAYIASTKDSAENAQCQQETDGYCDKFELQYRKETDGSIVTIESRNNTFTSYVEQCDGPCPTPPTQPAIVGSYVSSDIIRFTASDATCSLGSIQYKIRYNTSSSATSSMPDWSTVSWSASTTKDVNPGSDSIFYSQVLARCVNGANSSPNSLPSNVNTFVKPGSPDIPSVSASALTSSSIRLSWSSVADATSYTVTGAGNASSCTNSPCTITGLSQNTTYTFNVVAINQYGSSSPGSSSAKTLAAPATPAAPAAVWYVESSATASRWNWSSVSCSVGSPEYAARLYYPGYGSYSGLWTTTDTTTVPDTSSQGWVYRLYVKARCVNHSTGEVSGYSGETGSNGWSADYVRPITQPRTTNGWTSIGYSGNSLWGQSKVTVSSGCPSGTVINFRTDVKKNDTLVAQYNPTYVGQVVTWPSDLDLSDKMEFQWYSWCSHPVTGKSSTWDYADIFGNALVTVNRTASVNGRWKRTCGGSSSSDGRTSPCVPDASDRAVGPIAQ